jgi:hypothetical protein
VAEGEPLNADRVDGDRRAAGASRLARRLRPVPAWGRAAARVATCPRVHLRSALFAVRGDEVAGVRLDAITTGAAPHDNVRSAVAEVELVVAATGGVAVAAGPAHKDVGATAAVEGVVSAVAQQAVAAVATAETIVPGAARQAVVAAAADKLVVAASARKAVSPVAALQRVAARGAASLQACCRRSEKGQET